MKNNNMRKVPLLVIDYGSQTTQLILRRVREEGVYCEMVDYKNINKYLKNTVIQAIILSGGPASSFKKKCAQAGKKNIIIKSSNPWYLLWNAIIMPSTRREC